MQIFLTERKLLLLQLFPVEEHAGEIDLPHKGQRADGVGERRVFQVAQQPAVLLQPVHLGLHELLLEQHVFLGVRVHDKVCVSAGDRERRQQQCQLWRISHHIKILR